VDLWKTCPCHRFAYSAAHDSIPTSLSRPGLPIIAEKKDAVMFAELGQVPLFADLYSETWSNCIRSKGSAEQTIPEGEVAPNTQEP
jgi:hypothetical protein